MTVDFNANGTFSAVVADVLTPNNTLVCTTSKTGTILMLTVLLRYAMFNGGSVTESQAVV
jgi:hypothetical protein